VRVVRYARVAQIVQVRSFAYGVFRGGVGPSEILFVADLIGRTVGGRVVSDAGHFYVSVASGIGRLAAPLPMSQDRFH